MQVCINCTEEFFRGNRCPTCGGTNITTARAEREMYMKTKSKVFKCPKCSFSTESEEKVTCCPNCKWNVNVMKQLKDDY